jgi:menaquinol-cytochrome c reductase cytochrome b/c subunit
MAIATRTPGGEKETVRQKRERDQELLVWPDLVFVEFICAVLFTLTFVILSVIVNAPLLDRANANITPNPSKAPWYLMNLQELLLHMDKGLAGVTVPTVALIVLMAIPYTDRSHDGQGTWFGTANAVKITLFTALYSAFVIPWCILWDDGAHVRIFQQAPVTFGFTDGKVHWLGDRHPFDSWTWLGIGDVFQAIWGFVFLRNRLAIRDQWQWSLKVPFQPGSGHHDGYLDWPKDFTQVPVPLNGTWLWYWGKPGWMPGWMSHVYWYNSDFNIPAIMAEFVVPIATTLFFIGVLLGIIWKLGWLHTVRDGWLAIFTGFIMFYFSLTIIGAAFRGRGQQLVPSPSVPNLDGDPGIMRQISPGDLHYGIVDVRSGAYA